MLSAAFNYAIAKRGWKVANPVVGCKLPEPEGRVRWITRAEAAGLIQAADCPTSFSADSREKDFSWETPHQSVSIPLSSGLYRVGAEYRLPKTGTSWSEMGKRRFW